MSASESFEAHQTVGAHHPLDAQRPSVDGRRAFDVLIELSLSRMLLGVVSLRLRKIARGVLHEVRHCLLTAQALGLALNLRVDRAVRIYVFAQREAFCT